ncbi:helix-turn-helix transcriptional regulator [Superficieibacter sp.]|uniref:helix-turn-helix transcriptional regulator n=1 Tax=Superficieibacter sp. TaxID=2303322 RepID=UPI0028B06E80|nr:helix-turn-helix transcriptional regulator [Superficieibacter sp.]
MKDFSAAMTDSALAEALFSKIEARRKSMKITQARIAERVGITPKTYRALKSGSCNVLILLSILRELQLLENLNLLVPDPTIRPTEVWAQVTSGSPAGKREIHRRVNHVKNMMQQRKKIKTGE